jgi:hypothetical protein
MKIIQGELNEIRDTETKANAIALAKAKEMGRSASIG